MFNFGIKRLTSRWDRDLHHRVLTLYCRDGQKIYAYRQFSVKGDQKPWTIVRRKM